MHDYTKTLISRSFLPVSRSAGDEPLELSSYFFTGILVLDRVGTVFFFSSGNEFLRILTVESLIFIKSRNFGRLFIGETRAKMINERIKK